MSRAAALLLVVIAALPLDARVRAVRSATGWLEQNAITDARFAQLTKSARIVALGDATHGTHESYGAKQRLVPLLVANGFRTIAFEAPYAEWSRLDDYVRHGTGDPAEGLQFRMYWFWDTNEILDLIQWARAQNEAGLTPPIRITGIDSTEPMSAAALVVDFLRRVDPPAALAAEENYACLSELRFGEQWQWCRDRVSAVRPAIESKRDQYGNIDEILHVARIVEQGERAIATIHDSRDEAMAENLQWLVDRGEKVIVLGHNEHFGQTPYRLRNPQLFKSAGTYLSESLGDAYFVLGSLLLDGTFLAIEGDAIGTQIMTRPSEDDFAVLFDRTRLDSTIVALRAPLPDWLGGTHRMRIAASRVRSRDDATIDVPADLGRKFDAVLYVRRSTPTQLRHWPMF